MPKMSDGELVALVDHEFNNALGKPGGEIATERAAAYDYYLSKKYGTEIEGQSQFVTSEVSDCHDSVMPYYMRMFSTRENFLSFDPVGEEDEEFVNQQSDYIQHLFWKKNDGYIVLYNWIFDAELQKNGIVKCWYDTKTITRYETYSGLTEVELLNIVAPDEVEIDQLTEREEAFGENVLQLAPTPVTFDVRIKRTFQKNEITVDNVPPEEYRISADARHLDPSRARMVGHEREVTRTELIEMGFDKEKVKDLPTHNMDFSSDEKLSRYDRDDERDDRAVQDAEDKILLREAYIRVDYHGNGKSELRQVFTAGSELLDNQPADRQPFHVISSQPLPHKHFGRAQAEKVMDLQILSSTITRQGLDNLYHANKPGHLMWDQGMTEDTVDEILTTNIGRLVTTSRPVGDSYTPLTVPFTADKVFTFLDLIEKAKKDRTGVQADSEGLTPDQLKNIQQSVLTQSLDMSRAKIELRGRTYAETGFRTLFLHMHELVLKHPKKAEILRLRGKVVEVDPTQWASRENVTINIGIGIGTKEQKHVLLEAIWEKQKELIGDERFAGMVQPQNAFNTVSAMVRNANEEPARYFTPVDEAPQQGGAEAQLAQAQLQMQQMALQIEQQNSAVGEMRAATDRMKVMLQDKQADEKLALEREKVMNAFEVAMANLEKDYTDIEVTSGRDIPGVGRA